MVMAKANTLLFDGWWREEVVVDPEARARFVDLYRSYCRAMLVPMGRQAFVARLNGLGVREVKEKGQRWRMGVRLSKAEAPSAMPPVPADIVRITPYNPGEGEPATMLMLDITAPEDEASGRVAEELFAARRRQRTPKDAGGEGYSNEGDDRHAGDLALAASAYAFAAGQPEDYREFVVMNGKPVRTANFGWHVLEIVRRLWPFDAAWWKPTTPRADLVRAGALIIAAIEKIDRAEARARLSADEQRLATGL